jgi:hypothetical protein
VIERLVVLGRGGAGKSALARRIGVITGLPVIDLDGDLGPYDVLDVRLSAADTVALLDFALPRCTWRALRRSRERRDFWIWVLTYRRRWRPRIMAAIARNGPLTVHVLRNPRAVERFVTSVVEAGQLRDHVRDQRGEGGHPVPDGGARRREVHHEGAAGDADEPA